MATRQSLVLINGVTTAIPTTDTLVVGNGVTTSTGNLTVNSTGGTVSMAAALSFAANKGIAYTAGSGAADFSNGTGVTKTTTGAFTIGASSTTITNDLLFANGASHSIQINGGANTVNGRNMTITSGAGGSSDGVSAGGNGGSITIAPSGGGDGSGAIAAGNGSTGSYRGGSGGTGASGASGTGGNADLTGGVGGGGSGAAARGGDASLIGGAASAGSTTGNANGGDAYVRGGAKRNSGTNGVAFIGDLNTSAINLGASGISTTVTGTLTAASNAVFNWTGSGAFTTSTGTNTFSGNITFPAASSKTFDLSTSSGVFNTTTGAHSINGAVTFAANKGIVYTAGTGAADFSNGTGIFKTTTGASTFGGSTSTFTNSATFSAGLLTLGDINFDNAPHFVQMNASSGAAPAFTVKGGASIGDRGGDITIVAGASTGGNGNGGDAFVRAGAKNGSGTNGVVNVGDANTSAVNLAASGITTAIKGPTTHGDNATPTVTDTFFLGDSSHFWSTTYTRRVIGNSTTMLLINQPAATGSAVGCTISAVSNMGNGDTLLSIQNNNSASEVYNFSPTAATFNAVINQELGSNVASGTTITLTGQICHITGTTAIRTINPPTGATSGVYYLIADGLWTIIHDGGAGNVNASVTATVNKVVALVWDSSLSKWFPIQGS